MYKQTRIYGRIPYLVQKVHSFVLDCILYELLEIQESKFEITYIETCHCAVRLHYNLFCRHILSTEKEKIPLSVIVRRWYINYNKRNNGKYKIC